MLGDSGAARNQQFTFAPLVLQVKTKPGDHSQWRGQDSDPGHCSHTLLVPGLTLHASLDSQKSNPPCLQTRAERSPETAQHGQPGRSQSLALHKGPHGTSVCLTPQSSYHSVTLYIFPGLCASISLMCPSVSLIYPFHMSQISSSFACLSVSVYCVLFCLFSLTLPMPWLSHCSGLVASFPHPLFEL